MEHDLDMAKEKYKDAIEENGRLEARIQAFAINAQSEQDVLSTEVRKSYIQLFEIHMTFKKFNLTIQILFF